MFPNLGKGFHELNIKRRSEYKFPNCDELMSCSHCVICVLGEQQIMPVLPAIISIRQGIKTRLFIFISIIVLPPKHSLSSILAPPSPRAGGLRFMTIWQGAPTTAAWFGKLLCGAVPFGPRKSFDLKLTT